MVVSEIIFIFRVNWGQKRVTKNKEIFDSIYIYIYTYIYVYTKKRKCE